MLNGIRIQAIDPAQVPSSTRYAGTFLGDFKTVRLFGPCNLIRLVAGHRFQQDRPGDYWMEANLFQQARLAAARDLSQQQIDPAKRPAYAGMIVRFLLRDQLAVSRDWSDLDMFVTLNLPPGASVLALIGQAKMQPYYSPQDPAHAGAEAAGIRLPGLGTQIVIDFQLPDNRHAASLVSPPMGF